MVVKQLPCGFSNTNCIRCGSPNTVEWRIDQHGTLKFYCREDWNRWLEDKEMLKRINWDQLLPKSSLAQKFLGPEITPDDYEDFLQEVKDILESEGWEVTTEEED